MIYVPIVLLALVVLWLAYNFVQGFIQGFCWEMRRSKWRKLKGVWRQCERERLRRDL